MQVNYEFHGPVTADAAADVIEAVQAAGDCSADDLRVTGHGLSWRAT